MIKTLTIIYPSFWVPNNSLKKYQIVSVPKCVVTYLYTNSCKQGLELEATKAKDNLKWERICLSYTL